VRLAFRALVLTHRAGLPVYDARPPAALKGLRMSPTLRPHLRRAGALVLIAVAAVAVACGGDEPEPDGTAAALAERWLRVGEDHGANVWVYEREIPPTLVDLLNPDRTPETAEEDLVAFPVHPEGDLLGSYVVRRVDGSHVVWLFFDVPDSTMDEVTRTVTPQLDSTPWQVVAEQGNRSFMVVSFENSRTGGVTGSAVAEAAPPGGSFTVTVERDGAEVALTVDRAAPAPPIEAEFASDLSVTRVFPGTAMVAGLQEGDRIVRVGETSVTTRRELQSALETFASGPLTVALVYVIQFAPPGTGAPPFVAQPGLSLPENFPSRDLWTGYILDEYQVARTPQGQFFMASLLVDDRPTEVTSRVRAALEADGWEVVSDEAQGFATALQFEHAERRMFGMAQIDESDFDEAFTQVLLQIQRPLPGGN
jgi:hypothetical protein